ncbi:methyltransferase-like protein 27 [Panulirus ornatus]|uniref:methyltransferase-like protein 27 n=1 Tax=Panulirus ornatus TaxID=150431 RepID=UPI003A8C1ABF
MESVQRESLATLQLANKFYTPGQDPRQVTDLYSCWSNAYDKMLCPGRYNGPMLAAEEVVRLLPHDNHHLARILDMAAGTGQVGIELHKRGFTNVDALEPSDGMLKILKATGVYSLIFQEFVGIGQSTIPKGSYDVVVIVGGMGEGHVPVKGIDDMIRACKPGGVVVNIMRHEFLHNVEDYKDKLEQYMAVLERKGSWRREVRKILPNYFCDKEGIMFTHRVL